MEFQLDGTAALAAHFRPISPPSLLAATGAARSGADPGELGDLARQLEELVLWVRNRAAEARARQAVRFGRVEIEPWTQTVRRDGVRVPVTRTEFRLLSVLVRRPGRVVHREELHQEVWGPDVRHRSRAIDTHIARLRQKVETDPAHPRHILTVPCLGYRFEPRGEAVPQVPSSRTEELCELDVVGRCLPPRSA